MVLLLQLLLPRLLLLPRGRLVVLAVPLLQLLALLLVGGEFVAGELVEDGVAAGELISGSRCNCGCVWCSC